MLSVGSGLDDSYFMWWASVNYPFFFPVESVVECPRNCHGNGECVSGSCHCFAGFLGPDCSRGKSTPCFSSVSLSEHEDKYNGKATSM